MPLSEKEEFELLSLEREKATAQPSVPRGTEEQPYEKQAKETLASTLPERISANPIVRTLTTAASPIMGIAEKISGALGLGSGLKDSNQQLKEMQAKGSKALGYGWGQGAASDVSGAVLSPGSAAALKLPAAAGGAGRIVQSAGLGGASALAEPGSDVVSGAKGAGAGGGLAAIVEGLTKVPGLGRGLMKWLSGTPAPKAEQPAEGAAKVAGEMQRQRNVREGVKDTPPGASEMEAEIQNLDATTRPLREAAFAEKTPVDTQGALDHIKMLEANNPDAKVRAALKEARETIGRAAQTTKTANLPAAGARMTPAQLRSMQGQGDNVSVPMLDEVRQSINRQINQKGDQALDAHTKEVLASVRDKMLEGAPQSYHKYLAAERTGRPALDKFDPEQSVLGKLSSSERAAKPLSEGEAQEAIGKALTGSRKDRDLREMVEFTKHNPEAAQGFKVAYGKWLLDKTPQGTVKAKDVVDRWASSKDEMQKSGMFAPEHFAAIDKVMGELTASASTEGARKVIGGTLGFALGGLKGHPIMGAHAGANTMVNWGNKATQEKIETLLEKSMSDPAVAKILAGPPTKENLAAVERIMGSASGQESANEPPKRPSVLGMRAGGI